MKLSTKLNIGISTIAIIIASITLWKDCSQNRRINKLEYEVNSINYKPIVKVENILLTNFKEKLDSISFRGALNDSTALIDINRSIDTKISFTLKNVGNSTAQMIAAFCIDTTSGSDIIRKSIDKKSFKPIPQPREDYYLHLQLLPNESKKIDFEKSIGYLDKETFTIHLMLIYQNDLEILYDTYYWARFHKKELIIDFLVDSTTNQLMGGRINKSMTDNYVKYLDENITYKIYSKKESEELLDILSKFIK